MKFIDLVNELKSLSVNGFYTRGKIDWWLLKEERRYHACMKTLNILESEFPKDILKEDRTFKKNYEFIKLYEKLDEVSDYLREQGNTHKLVNLDKVFSAIKY
ncbi:hypothetical protein [Zunongwangia pacifica]|uniref:Uncharacterized protein n=1 Tax=Zunongwangia pacifica TaxID=2911062 RepID=A0A9X2A1W9_9FLAO|nr:hypothetical protein [Zunongwangia pacifica]MCL6218584.1 hypothetical protein [Zunongwangia pacifica]